MASEIALPDYSAADFRTEGPFQWLYDHRDNKFVFKQLTARMKEQAGALGVKGFIGLFNAYCESMAEKEGVSLERSTEFDGQPMELLSGEYICNERGVFSMDKFGYEIPICRHPIMPVQRLVNADSSEERMEIAYRKGRVWRSQIVEKSVIASSSKILDLAAYGIMVNSENAKSLSTYLLDIEDLNYTSIPEQRSIGRLGWIKDHGFSPYVEELVFDGETNFRHIFAAVSQSGSRAKWINTMKKVRAERGPGRLFLAASFASVILEPCGLLPFFLHAWGGSGVGKTVGLMIAASVWACPKLGEYITTFNTTGVGQEMTASFLNSLPMCVDELQIQSSQGVKDFDRMIYQLTEGVGRTRGAKTGGLQRQNTWKNCIITTGEHPISNAASGGGAVNRVIEFEAADKIYSDLVGLVAILNENYGYAGREFVEHLQKDGIMESVNEVQKNYYRELLQSDSTDKQAASASAILAADHIATELFFQDGNELTVRDMEEIMTKKDEVDVNARALEYVYEMVSRNPMHFKPDDSGAYKAEVWGKEDDDYIYIIKTAFDQQMSLGGFNSTSFLSWAVRQGLLKSGKGRRLLNVRFGSSVLGAVCLRKNKDRLEDIVSKDDELPY